MAQLYSRKDDYSYIVWANSVKRRDHFACHICGRKGIFLNSHHLNAWASYPTQRYDVGNGVCLCQSCHDRFHDTYGKGKNTKEQFEEFFSIMKAIINNVKEDSVKDYTTRRMVQEVEKDYAVQEILKDLDNKYGSQNNETNNEEIGNNEKPE